MPRRSLRRLKGLTLTLGAGVLFGGLSCVVNLADVVGTGLTLTAATGALGAVTQGTTALGAGLDLFADLVRIAP